MRKIGRMDKQFDSAGYLQDIMCFYFVQDGNMDLGRVHIYQLILMRKSFGQYIFESRMNVQTT